MSCREGRGVEREERGMKRVRVAVSAFATVQVGTHTSSELDCACRRLILVHHAISG